MSSAAAWTILGLDIGGTKTAVVEGDENAFIYQRRELPTEAAQPFDKTFPALADTIELTLAEAEWAGRVVRALSVSVGGPLQIEAGRLLNPPHLPGWHGVRLRRRLAERFHPLPVYVEHDGNAGALAEFRFGVGRGRPNLRHLIFLTFGTGLGAGIIVNGQVLHGATDTAGEVGHFRLAQCGPWGYGKAGSWEGFASGAGLVQLASFRYLIAGHTDAIGSDAYNIDLSRRRAQAVFEYLTEAYAIDPRRLMVVGVGSRRLKRPEAPRAAINRRVEVLLIVP